MPARSKTILVPLCCLIFGALIESSGPRISQHAECLRKCRLDRRVGAKTSVQVSRSTLSCNEQCLLERQECPSPIRAPNSSDWTPSEVSVVFGQYANTPYWYVNATWTSMNDSLGNWDGILIHLSVEIPKVLVDPVYCYVLLKNQTFFTANISSLGYQHPRPIFLRVTGLPFTDWASPIPLYLPHPTEANPRSTPTTTHNASDPTEANPRSTPTTTYNASANPPSIPIRTDHVSSKSLSSSVAAHSESGSRNTTGSNRIVVKYVTMSLGVLVGLILIAGVVMYLRRPKPILLPSDYKYHAFIIYKNEDASWTKELLTFLEEKHHLTCCIHYRDFEPGVPYPTNMANAVDKSYKVIAVFSKNFLKGNFTGYEMELAIHRLVKRRDNSLIVIRIDDVDYKHLPRKIKKRNFIDYNNLLERPFWKRKLLAFLGCSDDSVSQGNGDGYRLITGRPAFGRLDSTTSNDSAISYV